MFSRNYSKESKRRILYQLLERMTDDNTDSVSELTKTLHSYPTLPHWTDGNNFNALVYAIFEENLAAKIQLLYILLKNGSDPNLIYNSSGGDISCLCGDEFYNGVVTPCIARFLVSYGMSYHLENYPLACNENPEPSRLVQACNYLADVDGIERAKALYDKLVEADNQAEYGSYSEAVESYRQALVVIDKIIKFEQTQRTEGDDLNTVLGQILQERRSEIFNKKLQYDTLAANRRSFP